MSRCKLEEFISYEQPTKYIVDSDQYDDSYEIPVLTAGKSFILGYTDEKNNIFDDLPVIIFDDFTTSVQFVDFPFKVKSSAMKLLKNTEQADVKYCYYLLKFLQHTPENHKRQWLSATSQNTVELPTIEEQKNIVKKLDKILEVIDNQNKQLELLDEAIKARFVELFGDVQHEEKYKGIPLGELCTMMSGGTPSTKFEEYYEGDIPWISTVSLGPNHIDGSTAKGYITQEAVDNSATKLIPAGNILFGTRVGVGKSSINDVNICTNQDIIAIIDIDESRFKRLFVKHVLDAYQPYYDSIKKGATILGITSEDLKDTLIPDAPIEVQMEYVAFAEQVDKSKFEIQKSLEKTQQLYDSLMQKYFG